MTFLDKWYSKPCFLTQSCRKLINIGRYAVDLLARTCSCGRFQHDDVPCGHTPAVIQGYHGPSGGLHRSVRDFVAHNLKVTAFRATYTAPVPRVEITGLQPRNDILCRALLVKRHEVALKLLVLLLGSREHDLLLSMGPCRTFRTAYSTAPAVTKKRHNTLRCRALPADL